jgi:hypothetical protein
MLVPYLLLRRLSTKFHKYGDVFLWLGDYESDTPFLGWEVWAKVTYETSPHCLGSTARRKTCLLLSLQLLFQFCLFRYQLFVYCLRPCERRHHLHLDQFIRLARTFRAFNDLIHLVNGFKPLFPCHRFLPIKLSKVVRSARIFTAAAHAMAA